MTSRTVKVSLVAEAQGYIQGMDEAAKKTRETGSEAQKLAQKAAGFQALGKAGVAVGVAILGIGTAALATGIKYNTLQQTSRKALETLLGSAEAAADQMDRLDDFARTSPFAKQVFITAQQQLLAFGMEAERVVPTLDAIQNAVAATGGSNQDIAELTRIIAQLEGGVKLSAETFNQFGTRGVDAAGIIGEAMGKTGAQIREEVTAGTLDADKAIQALVDGMGTRFAGAADGVKDTFEGAVDRVKAAWRDFSAELARPLVDPNGGGALIDVLNWAADAMRMFMGLPEPVRNVTTAVVGLVGAVSLLGGTALLAIPKWFAFKRELAGIGVTGTKVAGVLGKVGGAALAIGAAYTAVQLLDTYLKSLQSTTDELETAFKGAKTAADVFAVSAQGRTEWWQTFGVAQMELTDLGAVLEQTAKMSDNFWARMDNSPSTKAATDQLKALGKSLAEMAATDLPAAQKGFNLLAKETDGSEKSMWRLLSEMPAYRDALESQARGLGLVGAETSEAERKTVLLELAQGKGAAAAEKTVKAQKSAAEAYTETADTVSALTSEINNLMDKINEANGIGQNAVKTNAEYLGLLEATKESLKEYAAEHGVTTAALDESTIAGSENAATLAKLAEASQEAAKASFDAGGSAEDYHQALKDGRKEIFNTALALTGNADAAQKLTDKIYAMPSQKAIDVLLETAEANRRISDFLTRWNNAEFTVKAIMDTTGMDRAASAAAARYSAAAANHYGNRDGGAIGYASGGAVLGFGGPRQDNIRAWLSSGEHVLTAPEVKALGGHGNVYAARRAIRAGDPTALARTVAAPQQYATVGGGSAAAPQFEVVLSQKGGVDLLKYVDVAIEQKDHKVSRTVGAGRDMRGAY